MAAEQEIVHEEDWIASAGGSGAVDFTKTWPLVNNPTFVFTVISTYLIMIRVGNSYMKNKEPLKLRKLMIAHNFSLVVLSTYIFVKLLNHSFLRKDFSLFNFMIEMPDITIPGHKELAEALWLYYMSKMFDLLDTAILIAKKRPVSVLHAYHHASMVLLSWILIRYLPSGASIFGPMLNSFVHMVMYTYYGLAAMGPHMQKYLWWKKYLTKLQMTQFVALFIYTYSPLLLHTNMNYPLPWILLQITYTVSLFVLFANFYYQTYISERAKKLRVANKATETNGCEHSLKKD